MTEFEKALNDRVAKVPPQQPLLDISSEFMLSTIKSQLRVMSRP
jgi:hypothetical protein